MDSYSLQMPILLAAMLGAVSVVYGFSFKVAKDSMTLRQQMMGTAARRCSMAHRLALHSACVLCILAGTPATAQQVAAPASATQASRQSAADWRTRNSLYYKRNWGVEVIGVKPVSSGYMLAFKYRVLDPEKAKLLNDRQTRAFLRDEATGNVLSVPAMENVGELRTGAAPEADRTYFMIFGNPGRLVKSGSRVSVVAGALHVDGLIVD